MASNQIASDWNGFFAGQRQDQMNWGGGTIQLQNDGTALYKTADGQSVSFDKNTNMFKLADQYKGIDKQFSDIYGSDWRNQASSMWGSPGGDSSTKPKASSSKSPLLSSGTVQQSTPKVGTSGYQMPGLTVNQSAASPLLTNSYQAPAQYNPSSASYNPSNTAYQKPDIAPWENIQAEKVDYVAPENRAVDQATDTVQGQMGSLLNSGSDYMQAAQAAGKAQANSRGLLNSSMAGKASQAAAIEAAMPIATQDAGFYQNRYLANQQGDIQSALSTQGYGQEAGLLNIQGNASSQLSAQNAAQTGALNQQQGYINAALTAYQGAINAGLSAQEASQQAALAAFNGAIQSGLSAQQAQQASQQAIQDAGLAQQLDNNQQQWANYRQEMEIAANERINNSSMSSEEKQQVSVQLSNMGQVYMQQLAAIQTNPDLSTDAKSQMAAQLQSQYIANVNNMLDIYGFTGITWTPLNQYSDPSPVPYNPVQGDPTMPGLSNTYSGLS